MKRTHGRAGRRAGAVFLALALALAAVGPMMTEAQAADATSSATVPKGGGGGSQSAPQSTGGSKSTSQKAAATFDVKVEFGAMTEEQKAVYDKALALYRGIEDAVLADLVTAGSATQADVDAYKLMRDAATQLDALDTGAWTAAQFKAYYEALQLKGDERKAALQALVDAGQLPQAVANVLSGDKVADLWRTLRKNSRKDAAVQTALSTMTMARDAFIRTLRDAGIMPAVRNSSRGGVPNRSGAPAANDRGDDREDEREDDD